MGSPVECGPGDQAGPRLSASPQGAAWAGAEAEAWGSAVLSSPGLTTDKLGKVPLSLTCLSMTEPR